jgi:hypothetical protein
MGEERGAYRVLVGKPEGKGPLGSPRHRLESDIKVGWGALAGLISLRIRIGGRHL